MARKTRAKARKSTRKPTARRPAKRKARPAAARAVRTAAAPPSLSREVVEEVLVHSARSSDGEQLSGKALAEIALCAGLDPARFIDAHRQLCEAVEEPQVTVLRVVELWDPDE